MPAFTNQNLLISVVRRGDGDKVVQIARDTGATGSTVLFGRGAIGKKWLRLLCLSDVQKELVFTVAPKIILAKMEQILRSAPFLRDKNPGFGIEINVGRFFHLGPADATRPATYKTNNDGEPMPNDQCETESRVLICVVVNAGLADDLMAAARDAGAKGGTILRARGTSREEDNTFFGITIVPEKELLMIMTPREHEKILIGAIEACECLAQPGVGVIFTLPVENFFLLGLRHNGGNQ